MNQRLIHDNEKGYYTLCLVISIFTYFALILSVIGIFYILIGVAVSVFLHGLSIGHIRSNGIKLTEKQFPLIYNRAKTIAEKMNVQEIPTIYVIQSDGVLNAFATRFFGRNFIVLYSDIVELTEEGYSDELDFVIAHELAHIQRKHLTKNLLILPARWIPFLGNAYSRACEFTCDRMATSFTSNPDAAINALTILAVGKKLFVQVDTEEYIESARRETGLFIWLSQILSTHPPLPKRITEVQQIKNYPEMYGLVQSA
ncbi:M48 family metallopeptidase [Litchfieldia salsa]|uniref:Zn-dependent protease with chaperone function n=1 Tax=Litchfieldia salsa TaxID=930152 RepID=A0A1H0W512_9BACI|nr:M48 family metallopeptidase [Litchfieldia salsa]SDP85688.1 Zn-dependent protease with chaperone function [Litchfieldia salsa]